MALPSQSLCHSVQEPLCPCLLFLPTCELLMVRSHAGSTLHALPFFSLWRKAKKTNRKFYFYACWHWKLQDMWHTHIYVCMCICICIYPDEDIHWAIVKPAGVLGKIRARDIHLSAICTYWYLKWREWRRHLKVRFWREKRRWARKENSGIWTFLMLAIYLYR